MRIRLDLGYDGSGFHGWARQDGLRTVQGELEGALATALRVPRVGLTCAGRTDTGVHARGQVAHADLAAEPPELHRLVHRVNGILDPDVRVRGVRVVADGFDARFSALWRRYAYRVDDRGLADPLVRAHVLTWPHPLDEAAMNRAASRLLGLQDFAAFCKRRDGATTIRTLLELRWLRYDGGLVCHVRADAFCHHLVRSLVGCLIAVGEDRRDPDWPADVLARQVRDPAVRVAAAHGLCLEEVAYPPDEELAEQARIAHSVRTA